MDQYHLNPLSCLCFQGFSIKICRVFILIMIPDDETLKIAQDAISLSHKIPPQTHQFPLPNSKPSQLCASSSISPFFTLPKLQQGRGKWSENEQKIYIAFLQDNMRELQCRSLRKSQKVFLQMSRAVKSRSADQCRSHHQKLLKYHHSLKDIILYYKQHLFGKQIETKMNMFARTEAQEEGKEFCRVYRIKNRFRIEIDTEAVAECDL